MFFQKLDMYLMRYFLSVDFLINGDNAMRLIGDNKEIEVREKDI